LEIREIRGGLLAEPDAPGRGGLCGRRGAAQPGRELAGPSFEEWLKAAKA